MNKANLGTKAVGRGVWAHGVRYRTQEEDTQKAYVILGFPKVWVLTMLSGACGPCHAEAKRCELCTCTQELHFFVEHLPTTNRKRRPAQYLYNTFSEGLRRTTDAREAGYAALSSVSLVRTRISSVTEISPLPSRSHFWKISLQASVRNRVATATGLILGATRIFPKYGKFQNLRIGTPISATPRKNLHTFKAFGPIQGAG